jgi:phage shock protein E
MGSLGRTQVLPHWLYEGIMGLMDFLGLTSQRISAMEAKQLVAQGALLLDVRTPAEFGPHHIKGAKNIPVQSLASRLGELPPKSTPIVVYCQSGMRSSSAASLLRKDGYTVHDLGGIGSWKD